MSSNSGSEVLDVGQSTPPAAPKRVGRRSGDSLWGWLRRNPAVLAYALGPTAIFLVIALRRWHLLAMQPLWLYLVVVLSVQITTFVVDRFYSSHRTWRMMNASVICHVLAVTVVCYITGWGPEMAVAFSFVAVIDISANGSSSWTVSVVWSLAAIVAAQVAVYLGAVPTLVPDPMAQAVSLMGAIMFVFIARATATTNRLKENAERTIAVSEDRFRSLVQNSSDTTLVVGLGAIIAYASPAIFRFLGRTPEEVEGQNVLDLVHPEDRDRVASDWVDRLDSAEKAKSNHFRMRHVDGSWRIAEVFLSDLRDRPSVGGFVANLRDITERKAAEAQLAHLAMHDHLTGLPNRAVLVDRLNQAIARRNRHGGPPPVVMFLDLNRFKAVNDRLGHAAGDELLIAVAERLQAVLREADSLARFGGDEFVLLCEDATDEESVRALAERARQTLSESFDVGGHVLDVGVSIGIAVVDEGAARGEELLADADYAMYLAKAQGTRSEIRMFDGPARALARRRAGIEMDLANVLDNDELVLHYQPIIDLHTGRPVGAEALLRWNHPVRGLLGPDAFLDVAEQTGLIVPIGAWVLQTACAQVATWNTEVPPADRLSVNVNLSLREVADPHIVDVVSAILGRGGVGPEELGLVVEFRDAPGDGSGTTRQLLAIHDLGVRLAIDGFGPGHAFLKNLHELPVSAVKLDRSLLGASAMTERDEAVLRSVTDLAHTLDMLVVAAGVETPDQLARLLPIGCDFGQGYLLGRPQPADAFASAHLAHRS